LTREQLAEGKTFKFKGGDGVERTILQVLGEMDGEAGVYEYIIDEDDNLSHLRFKKGQKVTGLPN
jgi:hypothetical protein